MAVGDGATVLLPGEGKTVSFSGTFSGNRVTFVYREPDSVYSLVEWVAEPGAPAPPLHFHRGPTKRSTSWKERLGSKWVTALSREPQERSFSCPGGSSTRSGMGAQRRPGCSQPGPHPASSGISRN
jgi:hypothetical protein